MLRLPTCRPSQFGINHILLLGYEKLIKAFQALFSQIDVVSLFSDVFNCLLYIMHDKFNKGGNKAK